MLEVFSWKGSVMGEATALRSGRPRPCFDIAQWMCDTGTLSIPSGLTTSCIKY